jgi:hypothetical protein
MELGLRLAVRREPIGIFVWHGDNLSSTQVSLEENALADIDRNSPEIRRAKRFYRFRKLLTGGYFRFHLKYEIVENRKVRIKEMLFPKLKIRSFDKLRRS